MRRQALHGRERRGLHVLVGRRGFELQVGEDALHEHLRVRVAQYARIDNVVRFDAQIQRHARVADDALAHDRDVRGDVTARGHERNHGQQARRLQLGVSRRQIGRDGVLKRMLLLFHRGCHRVCV
jgi:hypothetical protein